LTAKKLLTPRFVLLVGVFLGSGLSQAVRAQCGVDLEAASYLERLQQSRERYAVSGTFLRESAGARDFISVNRSEDAPEGSVQYFNSNANNAKQSFGLPLGRYLDPCEVFEFYTLAITAGPKVAGKSTRVLQLRPRDTLRLGYSLALEEKSGVILRSDTISEKGELLERHEFATVTIASLSKELSPEQAAPTRPRFVKVAGLPNGYRARLARGFEERALFVSDGIAAATVIFEPLPSSTKPGEGAVRRGATLTYTRGSVVSGNNILVTVIGEVPLAAARVIADAVKLTAGQQ
jgi:sigma-E factor negative regulatory protein RseB